MTSLIMCNLKPNTYTRAQDVESSAQSTDASVPCTKQSVPSSDSTSDQPHQAKSDQVYKKKARPSEYPHPRHKDHEQFSIVSSRDATEVLTGVLSSAEMK